MSKINKFNKDHVSNIIALLSLLAVVINFYFDKERNEKNQNEASRITAISVQPRLKLDTLPRIDLAVIYTYPSIGSNFEDSTQSGLGPKIAHIEGKVTLKTTLRFKNVGTHLARTIGIVHVDTSGYSEYLRKLVLSNVTVFDSTNVKELNRMSDVLPGDTVSFTFETELYSFDKLADTLHYLLLYKNELDNYYDTYVWAPIKVSQIGYTFTRIPGTNRIIRRAFPAQLSDIAKLSAKPIESYRTYDKNENASLEVTANKIDKIIIRK